MTLSVRDDGPGMDPQTLVRCTEPFFTTKHRARGTGLGLALVRTAMERNAGHLLIDSQFGKGSTFTLVMPVAGLETPAAPAQRVIVAVRESRLRATILAILSGMDAEALDAEASDTEGAEGALVWIADDSADAQALHLFLVTGASKARAIVLGDWWSDDEAESAAGRVIQLDATPSYTTLQRTLHEVLTGKQP